MAIFGKADADLPLLTQFYQVALPDGWESNPEVFWESELRTWTHRMQGIVQQGIAPSARPKYLQDLQGLAHVHTWAVPLMDACADRSTVSRDVLGQLEQEAEALERPYFMVRFERTPDEIAELSRSMNRPPERIPKTYAFSLDVLRPEEQVPITSVEWHTEPSRDREIKDRIVSDLLAAVQDPASVARCPECQSAFILRRTDQQFCSHRCADRVSTRRRRQARKVSDRKGLATV